MGKREDYNESEMLAGRFTPSMVTELVEHWQETHGLQADGYCGPATQGSIALALIPAPQKWETFNGPIGHQPTRATLSQILGDPGKYREDREWVKENIIEVRGDSAFPGVPKHLYFECHRKVEPYFREAFRRAKLAAPHYTIERAFCYIWRPIRHKAGNPLSTHSWGIAVDIDPHKNYAKTFKRGQTPQAWSPAWNEIWPDGVPEGFVKAFQSCGFAWGSDWDEDGDTRDHTWMDPMHFEWVARDGKIYGV